MGDGFAQLGNISAVLGGFAVTFLAVVLTHPDTRRRADVAVTIATLAAACFFISALGWTLLATRYSAVAAQGLSRAQEAATLTNVAALPRSLSLIFLLGIFLLFTTLGLGGWLRSRTLGGVTTLIALGAGVIAANVLGRFIS